MKAMEDCADLDHTHRIVFQVLVLFLVRMSTKNLPTCRGLSYVEVCASEGVL